MDGGFADRTPAVVLARRGGGGGEPFASAPLDALDGGLGAWVDGESLPAVGELTALNFHRYEALLRPMLLLFLDLRAHGPSPDGFVGGKSGKLFNEDLVNELRAVQRDGSFSGRVAFAYIDGVAHADRMRPLGLYGGAARLPALAVNTNQRGVTAAFPERLPLERRAIREFLSAFLSKKLATAADAEAFAVAKAAEIVAPAFAAARKPRRAAPAETVGVSEQFGDASAGVERRGFADHVVALDESNFTDAVYSDRDVLVMIHERGCAPCAHMAVYYKKLAERFHDMGASETLLVARFDASDAHPPVGGLATAGELPVLVLFPAREKRPPWRFFSGVAKVQPMMRWVAENADRSIDLPDLGHLPPEDRPLYRQQVEDRERARLRGEF